MTSPRLFRQLALAGVALTLFVIVVGAYVRLSDAGLGCPDWPGCYGRIVPPTQADHIDQANAQYPERPVEVAKAWKEQIHRYVASFLGLLIIALAWVAWRRRRDPGQPVAMPIFLVALVVFQGILGMWTVTLLLKPLVVVAHLLGGLTTLALLWWVYVRSAGTVVASAPRPGLRAWTCAGLVVLYLQIALGGWTSTNYAAWACGADFPLCHGSWWPAMDFQTGFTLWHGLGVDYEFGILDTPARTAIHVTHRLGAVLTALVILVVAALAFSARGATRAVGTVLFLLLALQVSLGVANVWLGLPLPVAVGHTAGAALLLLAVVTLLHLTMPMRSQVPTGPATRGTTRVT